MVGKEKKDKNPPNNFDLYTKAFTLTRGHHRQLSLMKDSMKQKRN